MQLEAAMLFFGLAVVLISIGIYLWWRAGSMASRQNRISPNHIDDTVKARKAVVVARSVAAAMFLLGLAAACVGWSTLVEYDGKVYNVLMIVYKVLTVSAFIALFTSLVGTRVFHHDQ